MCGIFGFNGKNPPVLEKIKILGLYNQSRGKDSSGYYYNGTLEKEASVAMGEWDDFIRHKIIEKSSAPYHTFIGHVRQGSVGYSKGVENAHPFIIDQKLVLAHNGTLYNYKDMLQEYQIEEQFTVDSKALGALLHRVGMKPILEKYVGYAALLLCNLDEPDSILVYHGKTKEYVAAQPVEERPLFFLQTAEGVYFSSLKEALEAIRESEEEVPKTLIHNKVVKFKNGSYVEEDSIIIDREEQNVDMWRIKNKSTPTTNYQTNGYAASTDYYHNPNIPHNTSYASPGPFSVPEHLREIRTVYNAEYPDRIYYHRLRYYTQKPEELASGWFNIKNGRVIDKDDPTGTTRLFYEGVLIKKAYEESIWEDTSIYNPEEVNFALVMSKYSEYPVGNLEKDAKKISLSKTLRDQLYFEGKAVTTKHWIPLWSVREYSSSYLGTLIRITEHNMVNKANLNIKTTYTVAEYEQIKVLYTTDDYLFSNGMIVKKNSLEKKPNVFHTTPKQEEAILDPTDKKVKALQFYCDVIWESKADMEDRLPSTIVNALHLYHAVYLGSCDSYQVSTKEIEQATDDFLDEIIENKHSISQGLAPAYGTLAGYLKEAIISEEEGTDLYQNYYVYEEEDVEEEEDDVTDGLENFSPSTIDDVLDNSIDEKIENERADAIIKRLITKDFDEILLKAEVLTSLSKSDIAQNVAFSLFTLIAGMQRTILTSKDLDKLDQETQLLVKNLNKSA
ncbi:hypothetical protein [Leptolyngbya phage Lbo-JY46]